MRRFVAMLALSIGATVLLPSGAAHADRAVILDAHHDAPARFDIVVAAANNNSRAVWARVRVRDLKGGLQVFQANLTTKAGETFFARTVLLKNGTVEAVLLDPSGSEMACDVEGTWRLGRDKVRVRLPQDCLPTHGKLTVRSMIGGGDGSSGDPADFSSKVTVALSPG